MKRGNNHKLKQKREIFKARHGYFKKSNNRINWHSWRRKHFPGKSKVHSSPDISKIKDEDVLFEYAKKHNSIKAVQNHNLRDENKLLELINGDYGYRLRIAAVERIRNPETLINLIRTHYDWHVRVAALENLRICDESVFIDAALNDTDYKVRRCALKYINHQDTLVYLSRNDDDVIVRLEALKKIRNIDIIVYAAKYDPNWRVQKTAIELIDDADLLKEILKQIRDMYLRKIIENRIERYA